VPNNSQTTDHRDELSRVTKGFMRYLQNDNQCRSGLTGEPCRESERCGCYLEMQAWCDDE
jgi:hypothetical protein